MLTRIIIGAVLIIFVGLGTSLTLSNMKLSRLEKENKNLNEAVIAYEELIKVVPFNRISKERSENAKDDINATLSNDNVISDGVYRP